MPFSNHLKPRDDLFIDLSAETVRDYSIAEDVVNAALDAIGELMDGGSIELLTGDGRVLAS